VHSNGALVVMPNATGEAMECDWVWSGPTSIGDIVGHDEWDNHMWACDLEGSMSPSHVMVI